jgi:sialate O-acetylesterase
MKQIFKSLIPILFVLVIPASEVFAQVKLPAIFGDNMVLQQQTEAAIWGKKTLNSTVKVSTSWNNKSYTVVADKDGNWKLKVSTPVAGGPYTVTITDGKPVTLKNVMIGEVWVCSGQSNMEMPMKGFKNQPVT